MTRQTTDFLTIALVAGTVQVAAGVSMYLTGVYFAPWSMVVSLLVLLCAIVWASRRCAARLQSDGMRPRWLDMVKAGVAASVGTGVIYAIYNLVSITYVYPHFLDDMANAIVAMQVPSSPGARSLDAVRADLSASTIAVGNLVRLSVFGSVLSVVVALLMSARRSSRANQTRAAARSG